jgi:inosose dehydratase
MNVACHTITWGQSHFEEAIREIHLLGFHAIETFASVADEYSVPEFQSLIGEQELELISLYGGGAMHDPNQFDAVVESNVEIARFLARNGAHRLVLGPGRRPEAGPSQDDLLALVACANEIGKRTQEYGVLSCLHPHVYTIVERIEEIDFVFDRLNPEYVGLAADTAHFAKGNASVKGAEILLFQKYRDRIKYVHLKDWDPSLPPELTGEGGTAVIRDFTELGQGAVDLAGCIDILREVNYDGWLTIELDYTRKTALESVQMSKEFLESKLGLTI